MSKLKKINLLIFSLIVLVILAVIFIISPIFRDIKNDSRDLISQKENLKELQARISNLENFEVFYNEEKRSLKRINYLFIDAKQPIEFIQFLEKNTEENQAIIQISPASIRISEKESWPSLNFQVNLTTSFSNFLKFLEKLENSPYLIEIQTLIINRLSGSEGGGDINATLLIKVFSK